MVQQYNIKTLFLLYKGEAASGGSSLSPLPCLIIKYIHLHFFYTSVVDIFAAPVQKHKAD